MSWAAYAITWPGVGLDGTWVSAARSRARQARTTAGSWPSSVVAAPYAWATATSPALRSEFGCTLVSVNR